MRQKFSVTVADVPMNISCDETQETIDRSVSTLNQKIRELVIASNHSCTKTEAALLLALDYCTRFSHAEERIKELEEFVNAAGPNNDNFGASLLRGENETLRAELQISHGTNDALLQDNATLYQLHLKSEKQSADANARADRMHNQVLALMAELQELRAKLNETAQPNTYSEHAEPTEPIFRTEPTREEEEAIQRYSQMDIDKILQTAPHTVPTPAEEPGGTPGRISELLEFGNGGDAAQ